MALSTLNREVIKKNLQNEEYDVVIIGGGITCRYCIRCVSTRNESSFSRNARFCSCTSSRSTKLVHGGLRYLKQAQIKVVAETVKNVRLFMKMAPHVTTPEWMLLPMHKGGTFGKFTTNLGLTVYDRLAGVKNMNARKC